MIRTISILAGGAARVQADAFDRIDFGMGQVVSIVGPTGSGKTTLINDLELFANGDTPTGRRILINDEPAPAEYRYDPAHNPNRADHPAHQFPFRPSRPPVPVDPRAGPATGNGESHSLVMQTIEFANQLTGEPIDLDKPDDGAVGRPDAGAADRRRDHDLQHAGRPAR